MALRNVIGSPDGRCTAGLIAARRLFILPLVALLCALVIAADECRAGELVQGGDFESGDFDAAWVHGAGSISGPLNPDWADHVVVLDLPYGGDYSALLGFKYANLQQKRYAFMYQDVSIPAGVSGATLYFKFRQQGYDGLSNDPFTVEIRDLSDNTLATVVTYAFPERDFQFKDSGWIDDDGVGPAGYDMTAFAGQTVRLYFRQANGNDNTYETWVFVDDVSLVFRRYVDLIADGAGDDLFGDPGTGDGGTSVRSGETGETIIYLLDVENEGSDDDSYVITSAPPAGWSIDIRYGGSGYGASWTTPVVPAGSAIQAEVHVTIPPAEAVGGYETILDAVSASFGDRFDSAALVTNVVPARHLTDLVIDGDGLGVIDFGGGGGFSLATAPPDTDVTFQVDLVNAGTQADSFFLWFRPASPLTAAVEDGGVIHTAAFATGAVGPGGTLPYTLRVTVPADILGGEHASFLYAKSLTDTLKKDAVRAMTRVLAPAVDIIICGSGDDIVDPTGAGQGGSGTVAGTQLSTVYFPFTLQNEGGIDDSFLLTWDGLSGTWPVQIFDGVSFQPLPWTTPVIEAGGARNYILAVTIPDRQKYGTYPSILDAVSQTSGTVRESVTAGITICSGFEEVDLLIDGNGDDIYGPLGTGLGGSSSAAASPGDTVLFTITVENEGGENLFDLAWDAPLGWEVVIGDSSSTMRGVTEGTYLLEVRIPPTCAGGTFNVIVDGRKANKPFFIDSVEGVITVGYPRVVDALVDGDGDGLFGVPGAGGGGFAMRETPAGETVQFTIELQNEGGEAESYRLTWNGFAGWNATLDGSGAPFVTASIPAGGSALYTFEVTAPAAAAAADYDFLIDVVSTVDSTNVESVTARVRINPPPRIDLVIDGDGADVTAPAGSGGGGRTLVFGEPGQMATAVLEVVNRGGVSDSFRITWSEPAGWPAGSVLLSDGANDYGSPFVTDLIGPGGSLVYTVKIFVPAAASLRDGFIMDGASLTRPSDDSVLLEIATSCFITGTVFDDADHDGTLDSGESGWGGVTVILTDPGGDVSTVTVASGAYLFEVVAGVLRQVIEITPAGLVSLSPDTVAVGAAAAGDTVRIDFADVAGPTLAPSHVVSGPTGGFVYLPHVITAGTAGQAVLTADPPVGWIAAFYRDNNGDGLLDAGDTPLTAADLDLDPSIPGRDVVPVLVHVFIPPWVPVGTIVDLTLTLEQTVSGTTVTALASVVDRITVLASSSGMLQLTKGVDLAAASPGDTITYTITFVNPGLEDVQEIEISDPVPAEVDLVADAFGPGLDITWMRGGAPVYLTADPADADEAMLMPGGTLRIVLSRQAPFVLGGGESGQIIYRVRIK